MATTISTGTNPYKLGSPPDFGTLYSGRALEFDGVTDYVHSTISGDTSSVFGNQSDLELTISFWFKANSLAGNEGISQWARASTVADGAPLFLFQTNSGGLRFLVDDTYTSLTGTFSTGTWYHFAITRTASDDTWRSYINGSANATYDDSGSPAYQDNANVFYLGTGYNGYADVSISNVQIWDKVWSLSDVQYAYTHPEKLITDNSAVTSGTTISNLKAWYPCTEGNPRSPQTTVYDGSHKELGSDLVTNGDFSDATSTDSSSSALAGWANAGTHDSNNKFTISGGACTMISDGTSTSMKQAILTVGKVYKVTVNITDVTSGGLKIYTGSGELPTNMTTTGIHTIYKTAEDADLEVWRKSGVTSNVTFDDISVKEVQMGNHGTTTFYGDELFDADAAAGTVVDQWDVYGSNTIAVDSGKIKITYVDQADGAKLYLTDAKDLSADLVVGRTYRFACDAYVPSGDTVNVSIYNGTAVTSVAVTATSLTAITPIDFVCDNAANTFISNYNNMTTGDIIWLDNLSLKEIGVAAGWTTADAEPLIPQTALMGMSKPMVFDGIDDYVSMGDTADTDVGTADFSISAWIHPTILEDETEYAICGKYHSSVGYVMTLGQQGSTQADLTLRTRSAGGAERTKTAENTIVVNKWQHVVVSCDRDGTTSLYINGASHATSGSVRTDNIDVSGNFEIGAMDADGTYPFAGTINEVSVWSSALSLAEVQAIFNDGVALDVSSDSGNYESSGDLVGYWRNDGVSFWQNKVLTSNVITINEGAEYSNSDVTLTVNNGALVLVNDVLVIEEEQLLITAISTHDLTVVRGYNGTTASAHDDGTNISVYHNGTITGSPDTILLPEGTTSGKDILGFPLTNPNNGWLNLHRPTSDDAAVGSYVKIPDNDVLDFGTGDFTIQCWVRPDSIGSGHSDLVGSHEELPRLYLHDNITPKFVVDSAGGTAAAAASLIDLTVGTWYMITGVLDKTNGNIEIWENITKRRTSTTNVSAQGAVTQTNDWYIGNQNGSSFHFDGSIDEVRIYKKALSTA